MHVFILLSEGIILELKLKNGELHTIMSTALDRISI